MTNRSVTDDHIVCPEDGKTFKALKRHIMTNHEMTPDTYRVRWGLKPDYPMVAPAYAASRSALAKSLGPRAKAWKDKGDEGSVAPAKSNGFWRFVP